LFVGFGSITDEPASAILVNTPSTDAVTVTVTLVAVAAPRAPRFQVTMPELFTPLLDALTYVNPAGNESVATTPVAVEGPKFVTMIVYAKVPPTAEPVGPVFIAAKSANGVTVVTTGGVTLLVKFGSGVGDVTLAVLVSEPLVGAVTTNEKLVVAFAANEARFQLTTPAFIVPLPVALTKVTPAGNASVTTTLLAVEGPKLVTVTV